MIEHINSHQPSPIHPKEWLQRANCKRYIAVVSVFERNIIMLDAGEFRVLDHDTVPAVLFLSKLQTQPALGFGESGRPSWLRKGRC